MNSAELVKESHQLGIVDGAQLLLYTERGKPASKIYRLFARDAIISAQTALKLNLLDAIIPKGNLREMRARILGAR